MYPIAYLPEEMALQELDSMGVVSVSVSEAVAQSLRHRINLYKSRSHLFTLYQSRKPSLETPKTNPGTNHTNSKLASESPCCCHLLPYWFHHCIVPIEQSVSHRSRLKLVGFPIDLVRHFAAYSQKKYPEKFLMLWP